MGKQPRPSFAICRFNPYIDCTEFTKCYSCAWNPDVQERRMERIRGKEHEEESESTTPPSDPS